MPPDEIRAILIQLPEVDDARVLPLRTAEGTERLAAYVTPAGRDSLLVPSDVRALLSDRLDAADIPGTIVVVDDPCATLQSADLAPPWQSRPEIEPPYAPPRDAIEQTIAIIWADVLALDRVGVRDDFFVLGGNSFLSVEVLARLSALGLTVDARTFFENPTVAELAAAMSEHAGPLAFTPP